MGGDGREGRVIGSPMGMCSGAGTSEKTLFFFLLRKISNYRKVRGLAQRPHYLFPASSVSSMESLMCEGV